MRQRRVEMIDQQGARSLSWPGGLVEMLVGRAEHEGADLARRERLASVGLIRPLGGDLSARYPHCSECIQSRHRSVLRMFNALTSLRFYRVVALVSAVAGLAAPAGATDARLDRCYDDWSTAAPIVRREALMPTRDVGDMARTRKLGDIVRITLCERRGQFVYRLVLLEEKGRLVEQIVDARRPF